MRNGILRFAIRAEAASIVILWQAYAWFHLAADQKTELAQWMQERAGFVLTADNEAENARKEAMELAAAMSPSELEIAQRLHGDFKQKYSAPK